MTVKELIDELSKQPQGLDVKVCAESSTGLVWNGGDIHEIKVKNDSYYDSTVIALISYDTCDDYCELPL